MNVTKIHNEIVYRLLDKKNNKSYYIIIITNLYDYDYGVNIISYEIIVGLIEVIILQWSDVFVAEEDVNIIYCKRKWVVSSYLDVIILDHTVTISCTSIEA